MVVLFVREKLRRSTHSPAVRGTLSDACSNGRKIYSGYICGIIQVEVHITVRLHAVRFIIE